MLFFLYIHILVLNDLVCVDMYYMCAHVPEKKSEDRYKALLILYTHVTDDIMAGFIMVDCEYQLTYI